MKTEAIAKCPCNICSGHIEFEASQAGTRVPCPHCGMETVLYIPQPPPLPPPPAAPSPPLVPNPNLALCPDCRNVVSQDADSCPKCGRSFVQKRPGHSVFYYVFWGVVSLFATLFIIGAVLTLIGIGVPFYLATRTGPSRNVTSLATPTTNSEASTTETDAGADAHDYIGRSLLLYDVKARYYDSALDGRVPGVEFKLRNNGERTLKKVEVTIYFKDHSDYTVSEAKYYPVWVTEFGGGDNEPLKPGYIWQLEHGRFYSAKHVPSEWSEGNIEAKITEIKFADK